MHFLVNFVARFHLIEAYLAYFLLYEYYTIRTKIPLVGTTALAQEIIIEQIRTELQLNPAKKIKAYDLGSGIGGLCLAIGREFPAIEVVGIELALPFWLLAVLRAKLAGQKNVKFLKGDFWQYNISDGNIVIFYLGDKVMPMLSDKLLQDVCANRLILSNTFSLPAPWVPVERIMIPNGLSKSIAVYRQNA